MNRYNYSVFLQWQSEDAALNKCPIYFTLLSIILIGIANGLTGLFYAAVDLNVRSLSIDKAAISI